MLSLVRNLNMPLTASSDLQHQSNGFKMTTCLIKDLIK